MDAYKKRKKNKNIEIVEDIKNFAAKKSARKTANKILKIYKIMKRARKTYLVNEEDLETTDYNEPQEDLFRGESIVEATNKELDFKAFKKDQANALKEMKKKNSKSKKTAAITAKKISEKYKTLKKKKKTYLVNEEDSKRLCMMMSLKKTYLKERAYLKLQIKFLTLENLKNNKKIF